MLAKVPEFVRVSDFELVWDDKGSGCNQDLSVWKVVLPDGCTGASGPRSMYVPAMSKTWSAIESTGVGSETSVPWRPLETQAA